MWQQFLRFTHRCCSTVYFLTSTLQLQRTAAILNGTNLVTALQCKMACAEGISWQRAETHRADEIGQVRFKLTLSVTAGWTFFPDIFHILPAQAWRFDSSTDVDWQLLPVGDLFLGGGLLCLQWEVGVLWINYQNWFQTTSWGLNSFWIFQRRCIFISKLKHFSHIFFPFLSPIFFLK